MLSSNRQSKTSSPAASANGDLQVIVTWLRSLSSTEIRELREALANHDDEKLAHFDTRFQSCLERCR